MIVTPIVGVCDCSMFCCALLCVHSSFAIISMGKKELAAKLRLSSWCSMIVVWLFLTIPWFCLQFVLVVFPDHTHLLSLRSPVGKGLTSCLSCLFFSLGICRFPIWCPWSGVVLDCIDSWLLSFSLLYIYFSNSKFKSAFKKKYST